MAKFLGVKHLGRTIILMSVMKKRQQRVNKKMMLQNGTIL